MGGRRENARLGRFPIGAIAPRRLASEAAERVDKAGGHGQKAAAKFERAQVRDEREAGRAFEQKDGRRRRDDRRGRGARDDSVEPDAFV